MVRLRLSFSKLGKVRFVGSRDSARIWERTLRKAGIPVVMSEGFTPRARIHFGLALGVAQSSESEYVDIDLLMEPADVDVAAIVAQLNNVLPPGMTINGAVIVDRSELSLQAVVLGCTWAFQRTGLNAAELSERVDAVMASEEVVITRTRKGNEVVDDVRPAIERLRVNSEDPDDPELIADLAVKPRSLRPLELLKALGIDAPAAHIRRIEQWTGPVDARSTPLEVPSARTEPLSDERTQLRVPPPQDGGDNGRTPQHERINLERLDNIELIAGADAG